MPPNATESSHSRKTTVAASYYLAATSVKRGRRDSNPQPPDRQAAATDTQVPENTDDTNTANDACTAACTNKSEFEEPEVVSLEFIAEVLMSLSPDEWAILAQMLASGVEAD